MDGSYGGRHWCYKGKAGGFFALPVWGAYPWRGLFSEFYGIWMFSRKCYLLCFLWSVISVNRRCCYKLLLLLLLLSFIYSYLIAQCLYLFLGGPATDKGKQLGRLYVLHCIHYFRIIFCVKSVHRRYHWQLQPPQTTGQKIKNDSRLYRTS